MHHGIVAVNPLILFKNSGNNLLPYRTLDLEIKISTDQTGRCHSDQGPRKLTRRKDSQQGPPKIQLLANPQ